MGRVFVESHVRGEGGGGNVQGVHMWRVFVESHVVGGERGCKVTRCAKHGCGGEERWWGVCKAHGARVKQINPPLP